MKDKLEKFLAKNPAIANKQSLEEYKSIVRLNMYGALAQIVLLAGAFICCIGNILNLGFRGAFSLFLVGIATGFLKQIGEFEEKARTLSCATIELERQYQTISHVWKKKALPNF
ncbi:MULTISPECIES: hypothetical protein [Nostocales]|uniref:Uncharacterized protein n=2 Tax=Nostocales TaxID=1161 RepID=A0A8S9T3A5_9CYAN|nr:hypothetical protein [Tolypothrix bouteillei]KAF3886558.1 hypothetical protein DA73_0400014535 [Tolypothrix bouteillei VB521301]